MIRFAPEGQGRAPERTPRSSTSTTTGASTTCRRSSGRRRVRGAACRESPSSSLARSAAERHGRAAAKKRLPAPGINTRRRARTARKDALGERLGGHPPVLARIVGAVAAGVLRARRAGIDGQHVHRASAPARPRDCAHRRRGRPCSRRSRRRRGRTRSATATRRRRAKHPARRRSARSSAAVRTIGATQVDAHHRALSGRIGRRRRRRRR